MHRSWYDRRLRWVRDLPCGDLRIFLEVEVRRVVCRTCGRVRQERLDWLAANPNDLSDPPLADPIVQLVVHEFAEPSLLGSS